MNKQQFIKHFNLEKIDDNQLISYMNEMKFDSNIISMMKKIPIEMYKHTFDGGTILYVSFNNVINKIIAEFYFAEDTTIVSIFNFIIEYLNNQFNVKTPFAFKDCNSFIDYYNNRCLDCYNNNLISIDQLNNFMKIFNDLYFKNVISFGFDVIKNIPSIKYNDFSGLSDDGFFTF